MNSDEDNMRIKDILQAINIIENYVKDVTEQHFMNTKILQDSIIRNFEIIGEAIFNLSDDFKNKNTYSWNSFSDFGDILLRRYFEVDLDIIWDSISSDLPELRKILNISTDVL